MRAIDLTNYEHAVFKFLQPTKERLNRSVAWLAECKLCGKQQLVGASQVKHGQHARCIYCGIPSEINSRKVNND